jgi:glycosyltransferase involved in cell wall biosynthesis
LLSADSLGQQHFPDFQHYAVPGNMTPHQGSRGHLRRLIWTQTQLSQIYRQQRSSLIFSPVPEAPLAYPLARSLAQGCRTVVMMHDLIPLRFPRWRSPLTNYFRWVVPWVLKQSLHILANSQSTAEDVQRFYGIPASKVTAIPLAYDAQAFRPQGLPKGNYFLYLGRPDPYKNLGRVIEAFAQTALSHELELWVAGGSDPRFTPGLQAQVDALGLTPRVKFLPYVPYGELPGLIEQAIALVFPSLWEGFGLPVLEAMACGTPVITSDCSALPEVAGPAALLVDPRSVGAIAEAMGAIASDGALQAQLRSAGLARAQAFSWAQTQAQTLAVLERWL